MKKYVEVGLKYVKEHEYTKCEIGLIGALIFLTGLLPGIIISPKGDRVIGSFNGNVESTEDKAED